MPYAQEFHPFATEGLVNLHDATADETRPWIGFCLDVEPENGLLSLAEIKTPQLPHLRSAILKLDIEDVELPDLAFATSPSTSISVDGKATQDDHTRVKEQDENIWDLSDLHVQKLERKLVTWDEFNDNGPNPPHHVFASEASPAIYDLLLHRCLTAAHNDETKYVKRHVLITSLFDLSLGCGSSIFTWNGEGQRFEAFTDKYTSSGLSQQSLQHVVEQYLDAGAHFRRLSIFGRSRLRPSPVTIAVQAAINSIMKVMEDVLEPFRLRIQSIIQLQETCRKPLILLGFLDDLSKELRGVSSDKTLINVVLTFAERISLEDPQFENLVHEIVVNVLQPALQDIKSDIGLMCQSQHSREHEETAAVILTPPTARLFAQAKHTLQILRQYDDELVSSLVRLTTSTSLKIKYSLSSLADTQDQAYAYEQEVKSVIIEHNRHGLAHRQVQPSNPRPISLLMERDPFILESDLFSNARTLPAVSNRALESATLAALTSEVDIFMDTIPSSSHAVDLSLRPMIRAQHRLLSYTALRILFLDHHLMMHLKMLHRFQLLTDGGFVSKISASLFDSEQASGEGKRRTYAKTGLRLEDRNTWPPASSELRLALMSILTESMSGIRNPILVDSVSFAIRDLSDEDLERCRDVNSIYALDFLRLNHKAPSTIVESVITARSLEMYDQIFNQLLRLLRVQNLTQTLLFSSTSRRCKAIESRSEHRFKMNAQRFISALAEYCQSTVIGDVWSAFEAKLQSIKDQIEDMDYDGTLELAVSLEHLQDMHEGALDQVMRGLLLKRRQSEGKGIIDRLMEVILRFAASTSTRANPHLSIHSDLVDDRDDEGNLSRLLTDYEMHMKTLIRWLTVESARAGNEGGDMFVQLLLKLDWNNYWSR